MNTPPSGPVFRGACLVVLCLYALLPQRAVSAPARAITAADAFALLKSLAGEWTGNTSGRNAGGPSVAVVYRPTAAGSVVEERLFPGTTHEMVTMYHLDGSKLIATHYCAMGNQPRLVLAPESTREELIFNFLSATNLTSPEARHMRGGRIRVVDGNSVEAAWEVFENGVKVGENRFFLRRRLPQVT